MTAPERPRADDLDVDARFLLANERTLLAWVRTALTLLAAGAGVEEFADRVPGRTALAALLILVGSASATAGAVRYVRADAAIRRGALPPSGRLPWLLAGLVAFVGLGLLAAVLLG